MGAGIASMHYIGMAAMRLPAVSQFNAFVVALSVVLAILISLGALSIAFQFRNEKTGIGWEKVAGAVVMGSAIPVMHYTGMAAASFTPSNVPADLSHAVNISLVGTTGIAGVTFVVLFSLIRRLNAVIDCNAVGTAIANYIGIGSSSLYRGACLVGVNAAASYVEGRIRTRQWQDQQGQKRYSTEIVAQTVQMLGPRSDRGPDDVAAGLPAAVGQPAVALPEQPYRVVAIHGRHHARDGVA